MIFDHRCSCSHLWLSLRVLTHGFKKAMHPFTEVVVWSIICRTVNKTDKIKKYFNQIVSKRDLTHFFPLRGKTTKNDNSNPPSHSKQREKDPY